MLGFLTPAAQAEDAPAPPSGYPSWTEVEAAKGNQAAAETQIAKIQKLLTELQQKSEQLGTRAITTQSDYAAADQALSEAKSRTSMLDSQVKESSGQTEKYSQQAAALLAQQYKSGSATWGVLKTISELDSPNGLQDAGLVAKAAENSTAVLAKAQSAQNSLDSLKKQYGKAQSEQENLTGDAQSKRDTALAAQQAVGEEVTNTQQDIDRLRAQLEALGVTAQDTENRYNKGAQAQKDYEAAQAAKQEAAKKSAQGKKEPASGNGGAPSNSVPNNPALQAPTSKNNQVSPQAPRNNPAPAPVPPRNNPAPAPAPAPAPPPPPPPIVPPSPSGAVNDPAGAQAFASASLANFGWGQDQFSCLVQLWNRESNWMTTATNRSSGAYGIPQSLPASKMSSVGSDWLTNYRTQITWGLGYIRDRYKTPCGAWGHSQSVGWY